MLRKEKFCQKEYYHIYSRALLNNPVFNDKNNARRLKQAFLLANSTNSGEAFQFLRNNKNVSLKEITKILRNGDKLADILCYVIMPDHYHLLLRELKNNGIINFIRKCNTSIAKYINIKNNRLGPLFESRFKSKHINTNAYLLHLSLYIHLNPLDIISGKEWRENKLKNWNSEKKKLFNYPWSSLKFYLETNYEDPIISGTEIITKQFSDKKDYEIFLKEWADGLNELKDEINNYTID